MAKLPSIADMGPTPRAEGSRAIATYDPSPIARGGAAQAEALSTFGKGVEKVGEAGAYVLENKGRYENALATSGFNTDQIDLTSSLAHDQDYATLQDRHNKAAIDLQSKWAQSISTPSQRERFLEHSNEIIARSNAAVKEHAFKLEGSAQVAYVQKTSQDRINKTLQDPTNDAAVTQAAQDYSAVVDGLQGRGFVTPEQGLAMKQQHAHQFALAHGIARSDVDPAGVLNELRAKPGSPEQIDNRIIQVESNGDPLAKNPRSSASGLGQFTNATWLALIKSEKPELAKDRTDSELLALRADKNLSREMVTANRVRNTAALTKEGIEPTAGNVYLAHFLGAGDAALVLKAAPNTPVADILDPKVIQSNPLVLGGKTAGTVAQWAEQKMGGVGPGGGQIYDILRPDQREVLRAHAEQALHGKVANDITTFHNSANDDVAQANRTGLVENPKTEEQFIAKYGIGPGQTAYRDYKADLQAGADRQRFAGMSAADMQATLENYKPEPDSPGYANAAKRQDSLAESARAIIAEREKDPAAFAINRLPVVAQSYRDLSAALADPTKSPEDRAAAARDFATKTIMEQQRIGIPAAGIAILPRSYVDSLKSRLTNPKGSGGPQAVAEQIENEAKLWGDNWNSVYRQVAKDVEPIVRVIGSGLEKSTARLVAELAPMQVKDILKDEDTDKAKEINAAVLTAFKPFRSSVITGNEGGVAVFNDYRVSGEKLAAYYVVKGEGATDAAEHAFKDLLGHKYEFRDTYRIPKSLPFRPDDISIGLMVAKGELSKFNIAPERDDIGGLSDAYLQRETEKNFKRDGIWVTSPDESGLMLTYKDEAVRTKDNKPLIVPWKQLAGLASREGDKYRQMHGDPLYETGLTPAEESKFKEWKQKYAPQDSGEDYDFRGAFKAGLTPGKDGHWPDTFKKPNHPTFSVESIYAEDSPKRAGRWEGERYIPPGAAP